MLLITQLFEVDNCQSILRDDFTNNKRKWEITNKEAREAFIKDGSYWMENKSNAGWNYYKIKSPIKTTRNFIIDTKIELLNKNQHGHFGLVWGFDKNKEMLNRFSLSADGERVIIMQFEKNHRRVYHRFHLRILRKINLNQAVRFTIIKIDSFFYFLIDESIVNISHESHFINGGPLIGYYLEPLLSIRSKYIEVKKIKATEIKAVTGLNKLIN